MKKSIFKHLNDINKGYWSHFSDAIIWSFLLLMVVFCLIIHAIIPCIFTNTGTYLLRKIIKDIKEKNNLKDF